MTYPLNTTPQQATIPARAGKIRRLVGFALAVTLVFTIVAVTAHTAQKHSVHVAIAPPVTSGAIGGHETYTVVGNHIVNSSGRPVLVHGVDRSSLENSCTGATVTGEETGIPASDFATMHDVWGATVVRLPLDQEFWLSDCRGYRATVRRAVSEIEANHMIVILDLHWWTEPANLTFATGGQAICMPNQNSVLFWKQVAHAYMHDPNAWFELYNEPDPQASTLAAQWRFWLNGGEVPCLNDNTRAPMGTFAVVGMQRLANAIRSTGASNIILADGINHPMTLQSVPRLRDTNIAYVIQPYATKTPWSNSEWDTRFGNLATHVPVVATEFGDFECGDTLHASDYDQAILSYFRVHEISYLAWDWFAKYGCVVPELITNAAGECKPDMGCTIEQDMKSYEPSSISLAASTVTVRMGSEATVRLACKGAATCSGRVTLTTTDGTRAEAEPIGSSRFSIPPGKSTAIGVTLNPAGRALLSTARGRRGASLTILKTSPGRPDAHNHAVQLTE